MAVERLKCDKAGVNGLYAECVKFAHRSTCSLLRKLFNACIKYSFVPINFCSRRIVQVPKKSHICDAFGDYRPVTSVNVLAKVFEYCLLEKLSCYTKLHDLQFGFTAGGGCEKAVFVLKSVVEYFVEHGIGVYLAALDISKVYDRVDHRLLLPKLINVGIAYDIVFVCWYWFRHLFGVVDWINVD